MDERDEVLEREEVERLIGEVAFSNREGHPSDGSAGLKARHRLLAHDAALRAENEALKRENEMLRADKRVQEARDMVSTVAQKNTELKAVLLRHTCNCGPDREPDPDRHADYCEYRRARQALDRDGGDDGSET